MSELKVEKSKNKTNTIILVEGVSDLAFLSLLLEKWDNYSFVKDIELPFSNKGMKCSKYSNDYTNIFILSVGGIDCFNEGLNIIEPLIKNTYTTRLIIIMDNDQNMGKELLNKLSFDFDIKANKWIKSPIEDDYKQRREIDMYIKLIPSNESGALETIIIKAMEKMKRI